MNLSSGTRKLALVALVEQLKAQIEIRVRVSHSAGGAASSWSLMEELKNSESWVGDRFTEQDTRRRNGVRMGYDRDLANAKQKEEELWAAIGNLMSE